MDKPTRKHRTTLRSKLPNTDNDPRFSSMHTSMKFKKPDIHSGKIQLDDRFAHILTDERFSVGSAKIDKYGRKIQKTSRNAAKEELETVYFPNTLETEAVTTNVEEDTDEKLEQTDEKQQKQRMEYLSKLSRGEIDADSSSESSEDIDEEEEENDRKESIMRQYTSGAIDYDETTEEVNSCHIAVLNCAWNVISANHILLMMFSYTKSIKYLPFTRVAVYPSNFGLERIKEEEEFGPGRLIWGETTNEVVNEGNIVDEVMDYGVTGLEEIRKHHDDDDDGNDDSIRRYEFERLRYYIGIVTCASPEIAEMIISESLSSKVIELSNSCWPQLVIIKEEDVKLIEGSRKARDFIDLSPDDSKLSVVNKISKLVKHDSNRNDSLLRSNITCSWDNDDDVDKQKPEFGTLADVDDVADYLHQEEEEEEDDDEEEKVEKINQMRSLLDEDNDDDDIDDDDDDKLLDSFQHDLLRGKILKKTMTPFELKMNNWSEKRNAKRHASSTKPVPEEEEVEEVKMPAAKESFRVRVKGMIKEKKEKTRKRKLGVGEDGDGVEFNLNDDRFNAMYNRQEVFNIDTTSKKYRETDATKSILNKQLEKRRLLRI